MFLQQARQLLPQRTFVLVGHCHRWFACDRPIRLGRSRSIIAFSTRRSSAAEKGTPINDFALVCRALKASVPSLL
jgi:hypothetical protein